MNKHQVKGTTNKVSGTIKEEVGRMTGDHSEVARGQARQVKGELQQGLGNAKETVRDNSRELDKESGGRRSSDR